MTGTDLHPDDEPAADETPERERTSGYDQKPGPKRAIVIHPEPLRRKVGARPSEAALEEAVGLTAAIDLEVVLSRVVRLSRPRPGTLIGQGTIEELAALVEQDDVTVVVVDAALTPVQQRNLEKALKTKVIDRTGLILEIFGARARTREGVLQVELAALSYQRTRLVRSWTHLERQRGGGAFLGGPGESQLEMDRRQIDDRILRIKADLDQVRRTRSLHRAGRARSSTPVVALVGYTNAGKSTLFNRLTTADVLAKDQLFATLDPTMRAVTLPSRRRIILSDTVGFIAELPTMLVEAFRATLEEVTGADLVLHVRDIADEDTAAQKRDVEFVLEEIGLIGEDGAPVVEVLNKVDLMDPVDRAARLGPDALAISALTGEGIDALRAALDAHFDRERELVRIDLDNSDGAALAWLYAHGEVVDRSDEGGTSHLSVSIDPEERARFERRFADALRPSVI